MCTNLAGPYTVTDKLSNDRVLLVKAFIDPATSWFEIAKIIEKLIK